MDKQTAALNKLIEISDFARFTRASDRDTVRASWENGGYSAVVTSAADHTYNVRVQIEGARAFRCSCMDHHFRSHKSQRPCKHVVCAASYLLDEMEIEVKQGA